ncbi:hypothetical protein BKA67DRAFT_381686 [Truncatella angustata]|uniref:Uncharacterized protein n=1 Tax=Truncatella angustata TaxID=152316 RepID=A0A9P8UFT1_9PEZI|nr:uncharacterized protein BKA67DRAFT_381686 [Truncatella angustata]KAH6649122.1 hypothetical protein BKA67DRAFT_381686 [Truncatella angustata]
MVAPRISNALRAASSIARLRAPAASSTYRTFTSTPRAFAQQGYGDGKGSPEGESPQKQPGASKAQQSSEHPGPSAPDMGQGSGNSGQKNPSEASAKSGGSRSKEAKETGSSPTGSVKGGEALKGPQGEGAPKPKIHNQSVSGVKSGLSEEQKREVEQHNADFEKRHDRAGAAGEDKVDQKFWQGNGPRIRSDAKTAAENDWNA